LSPSTRERLTTDLAIAEGVVAGWGRRDALEEVDLAGAVVAAGFVDAQMHLESRPVGSARVAWPAGTGTCPRRRRPTIAGWRGARE
jgi:adenine deaminase